MKLKHDENAEGKDANTTDVSNKEVSDILNSQSTPLNTMTRPNHRIYIYLIYSLTEVYCQNSNSILKSNITYF